MGCSANIGIIYVSMHPVLVMGQLCLACFDLAIYLKTALYVCMCICVCVLIYACVCVLIYACVCVYVYTYPCVYVYTYPCVYSCVCVHMCVYTSV